MRRTTEDSSHKTFKSLVFQSPEMNSKKLFGKEFRERFEKEDSTKSFVVGAARK